MPGKDFKNRPLILNKFKGLKGRFSFRAPMARHTSMRVGGPARALYQPESLKDLVEFVGLCKRSRISFLVIGEGCNIIVNDKGTKNIFVRLAAPCFKKIEACGRSLNCGGGVLLSELLRRAEENSLGGVEFLVGIPGTAGGAIVQNAGAQGASISDIVKDVKVLDRNARIRVLKRGEINFGYRRSGLEGFIILGAALRLRKRSRGGIRSNISRYMKVKLATQDYTAPSAGCIFKNPKGQRLSAAKLIDSCGLKGKRIGGACISERHANFIINKSNAKAKDILRLIALIKNRVNRQFGIRLEEEVKII